MKRSAFHRLFSIELVIIYTVLITGAVIFSFPFVWMVSTSFKTSREMSDVGSRFWPTSPVPRATSPYIDPEAFSEPRAPGGVGRAVWVKARPRLESFFLKRIDTWSPRTPAGPVSLDADSIDPLSFRVEMLQGLFTLVGEKLSDAARASGEDAIVEQAGLLADDDMLASAFDRLYRRIEVGACRVRGSDYRIHVISADQGWEVIAGEASLVPREQQGKVFQALRAQFTDDRPAVTLALRRAADVPTTGIDQVSVSYRGDASWARVGFNVVRDGQLYRSSEMINFSDDRWREVQLRWRDESADPMRQRSYYWLDHVGPAPPGSPPFAVEMTVTPNTPAGAWIDKALHNYRAVFREIPFGRYIMTSLALSILSIVLVVFGSTLSAYAFARLHWPGRDLCFVIMLATMMIPPQVTMVPSFLIFKSVGWYNTLLPLWAPAVFGTPFFIFLLRQFLMTIPKDLEDAARIDGCGFLRIYWHVMVPLVTPTIAIIAVFTFIATWNNFMGPLIYVNDDRLFPLAIGLFKFNLRAGGDVGLMMAASFIMTLPIILLFFFVQRYFIQGVTLTGMKG
jgi:multiple sugar transport system permease protein